MADSLSLEHPDVPWSLPATLPSTTNLRQAIVMIEAQSAPATRKHVSWCLAKLQLAFEPSLKLGDDDRKLRAETWFEACGDLGDELWSTATLAAIQTSKWMPKPAEFRKLVEAKLELRAKQLRRCKAMLDAQSERYDGGVRKDPAQSRAPEPDPEDVRLLCLLKWYELPGSHLYDLTKARATRERLAQLGVDAGEMPPEVAAAPLPGSPQPVKPPRAAGTFRSAGVAAASAINGATPSQVALTRSRAQFWRGQGNYEMAAQIEREAEDPPAPSAVAEAQ